MLEELNKQEQQVSPNTPQEAPVQSQTTQLDKKEANWRALEERALRAEREREELARQLAAQQQKPSYSDSEDELHGADDDLIERRHLKKYVRKQQEEITKTKEELQAKMAQIEQQNIERRLRERYPNIDQVLTDQNIEKLRQSKPAVYRSIMANPNLEDRGELALEAIQTWIETPQQKSTSDRIDNNRNKPRTASSGQIAENPLASIDNYDRRTLSESDRERLRQQVAQAKKGW